MHFPQTPCCRNPRTTRRRTGPCPGQWLRAVGERPAEHARSAPACLNAQDTRVRVCISRVSVDVVPFPIRSRGAELLAQKRCW